VPYLEERSGRRRRMAAVFAVLALGAAGVGVRMAAAAEDPAAAPVIQSTLESVDAQGHRHPVTVPEDYVRIADAPAAAAEPRTTRAGSRGTFTSQCGRNADGSHRNSDNFITSPGVSNAAHHTHDYVGNLSTDGNATDESLAAAGTTCRAGDLSTYFWPVIRDIRTAGDDADQPGGGADGNMGTILTPASVSLQFRGNAQVKVAAMPRFLRIITGDAKAVTNGPNDPNARAHWTCSGSRDKASTDKYPICPRGQLVQRINDFPGCWNGTDLDSLTHRTHTSFADPTTGACPAGTVAIPQLRITLSYRVPPGASYAVDSFPEQLRKAVTDHNDFEAVMPDRLMQRVVGCINSGRRC
jgi:Domain of unknown function (DUF1996)